MLRRILSSLAIPLLLSACSTAPLTPPATASAGDPSSTAPDVSDAGQAVVSAADPRAAEAGAAILRAGGSATDAAIATMLALNVVEPQSSGIGGGGFYVRGTAEGEVETIDGRETAPAGADPQWFLDESGTPLPFPEAVLTGLSIGVPGNLRLAALAHEKHGQLPWADLFAPAITLARDGFTVTPRLHGYLERVKDRAANDPAGVALYYQADGSAIPAGSTLRNPDLAETLTRIAQAGADSFYEGPHGQALAEKIASVTPRRLGEAGAESGAMVAADIAGYEAKARTPVCGTYRLYRICGMGPPSSGATTVYAVLKQLERFDLAAMGPNSPVFWHVFADSQRIAYADRELYLADSDFVDVPVAGLTDANYLTRRGLLIDPKHALTKVEAGHPAGAAISRADGDEPVENGTSHFVVIDDDGNAVSYTSTVEGPFGSGHMFGGFFLNNELTDFSFSPEKDGKSVANRVEGGKRPRSSMSPSVVYDPQGKMVLVVGAAGGGTIPVQVAKAIIGVIDFNLSVESAIALPGLYAPGDTVYIEPGTALTAMQADLEAMGHTVAARSMPFKANAAQRVDGEWVGAADPRSEGAVAHP
ncbi:gamma-glutamyltransferase [Altericroceibacterium endophyticum]|uniref:Glutathione hydrolase proenzyme n=1 Tax=Altericroceibacterium endophyticum TaxID=1808508 RepID=A0A6I4T6H2_9SPHN|nr:gamma-glutamyltransferase [Altericroceibacterium endophyticum]MXO65603.1 gamma-glutamyltransferase [Altericroceibacterium endophyticum]